MQCSNLVVKDDKDTSAVITEEDAERIWLGGRRLGH